MSDGAARLVVFLTKGMSLQRWDEAGILERELALYRRLQPHIGRVALVSYGDRNELRYRAQVEGMEILCNRWGLPGFLYYCLAPWLHRRHLAGAQVFKSNQTKGSELLLWAHRFHRRARIVARSGYVWSWNAEREAQGRWSWQQWQARRREQALFRRADAIVVTAEAGKHYLMERYRLPVEKIRVIPNYVDTGRFAPPVSRAGGTGRLVCVGRLHQEKNLLSLLEAIRGLEVELKLIGEGPLRKELERVIAREGLRARLLGARPHAELPGHLAQADLFILPSYYENHPKALLEAMACGMPVIGTDVSGIRELIVHRQTGYLCGTSPQDLRAAILDVLNNPALQAEMGRQAREAVSQRFSLERIAQEELALLRNGSLRLA